MFASVENTFRSFDLQVMLTPMGTILEGELEEVLQALRAGHEVPFSMGGNESGHQHQDR